MFIVHTLDTSSVVVKIFR